jgi:hypothetical protein
VSKLVDVLFQNAISTSYSKNLLAVLASDKHRLTSLSVQFAFRYSFDPDEHVAALANAVVSGKITRLALPDCCSLATSVLFPILAKSTCLRSLDLTEVKIKADRLQPLCTFIVDCPSLTSLTLQSCFSFGMNLVPFYKALPNSHIEMLDISNNHIFDATDLARYGLANNSFLKTLMCNTFLRKEWKTNGLKLLVTTAEKQGVTLCPSYELPDDDSDNNVTTK